MSEQAGNVMADELQLDVEHWRAALAALIEETLGLAQAQGADQAEIAASVSEALSVGVRDQQVETLAFTQQQSLALTLYRGGAQASVSITDLSREAREDAIRAALRIAKHTQPDPYAGLAEPEEMALDVPDLDLYHPWAISADAAQQLALDCEAAGLAVNPARLQSEGAGVSTSQQVYALGNSRGFLASVASGQHSMGAAMIARDDQGNRQRGGWRSFDRVPARLTRASEVGATAAERALRRLNPARIATARVPVLFSAEVASGLVGHFLAAIAGGSIYRGASFLRSRLNTPVFPSFVSLWEEPHLLRGAASTAFDGDGLATRQQQFVRQGELTQFALGTYSARRLGMASTANASGLHNVRMSHTGESFAELLRTMDRGLWVTQLMGQGVNLVTGDYSRGASGFWVEGGEVQFPVEEITIAGNLQDMFMGLQAVGTDVDQRGNVQVGSWLIDAMTVAGH